MNSIYVYTDTKSDNGKIFYGSSTSGKTVESKIERLDVKSRDDLIAQAVLRAPKDKYIITAFGPLKTTMESKDILDALEFIIEEQKELDVFYLTIYSDNCTLRTDDMDYKRMTFVRSMSPHGTECLLITPKGIERILDIMQDDHGRGFDFYLNSAAEKMMLYTSSPSLVKVDISKRTKETQLIKAAECREEIIAANPLELSKKYTGNMNLFWFFLIVIAILFLAAMILSFEPTTGTSNYIRPNVPDGKPEIAASLSPYTRYKNQ